MTVSETQCDILLRPDVQSGYLPEGPYPIDAERFSWVSIQHAVDSTSGSLNIFDLASRSNSSYPLSGRPGFAFPTDDPNRFVIGLERSLGVFDIRDASWTKLADEVDSNTTGTIINDGVVFSGGVIFGCKDLKFEDKKAGLYLFRSSAVGDGEQLVRLRDDQLCSNGKIILKDEKDSHVVEFLDIDTPTKQVVKYSLDIDSGSLSAPETVLDLTSQELYPDGMVATPDGSGVIIAMFNPEACEQGEARQYDLASGKCVHRWIVDASPQVTCPMLMQIDGGVKLVLTTAAENMSDEKKAAHPNAGCLFIGDTPFESVPDCPKVVV